MRFLLIFLGVLLVAWRWRTCRTAVQRERKDIVPPLPAITNMVVCRQCGVHIPVNESVAGREGSYCSAAHRLTMEP